MALARTSQSCLGIPFAVVSLRRRDATGRETFALRASTAPHGGEAVPTNWCHVQIPRRGVQRVSTDALCARHTGECDAMPHGGLRTLDLNRA